MDKGGGKNYTKETLSWTVVGRSIKNINAVYRGVKDQPNSIKYKRVAVVLIVKDYSAEDQWGKNKGEVGIMVIWDKRLGYKSI